MLKLFPNVVVNCVKFLPLHQNVRKTIYLTLKMTSAQVVEMSFTNNSSFQNYPHPGDHNIRTTENDFNNLYQYMHNFMLFESFNHFNGFFVKFCLFQTRIMP